MKGFIYMSKKISISDYYETKMKKYKDKIIFDRKKELIELKKRIEFLEKELQGMGVYDFDLHN